MITSVVNVRRDEGGRGFVFTEDDGSLKVLPLVHRVPSIILVAA